MDKDGSVGLSPVVKVEKVIQDFKTIISPNPVKNELRIQTTQSGVAGVRILTTTGVVLMQQKIPAMQQLIIIIRKPQWSAGLYYAEWFNKDGQVIGRTKFVFE